MAAARWLGGDVRQRHPMRSVACSERLAMAARTAPLTPDRSSTAPMSATRPHVSRATVTNCIVTVAALTSAPRSAGDDDDDDDEYGAAVAPPAAATRAAAAMVSAAVA